MSPKSPGRRSVRAPPGRLRPPARFGRFRTRSTQGVCGRTRGHGRRFEGDDRARRSDSTGQCHRYVAFVRPDVPNVVSGSDKGAKRPDAVGLKPTRTNAAVQAGEAPPESPVRPGPDANGDAPYELGPRRPGQIGESHEPQAGLAGLGAASEGTWAADARDGTDLIADRPLPTGCDKVAGSPDGARSRRVQHRIASASGSPPGGRLAPRTRRFLLDPSPPTSGSIRIGRPRARPASSWWRVQGWSYPPS